MPHRSFPSRGGRLPRLVAAALLSALASWGAAQDCTVDAEPNDTPAAANPHAERTCIVGDLGLEGDAQDAFFWEVSEEEARAPWRVTLEGIDGQLTRMDVVRVTFADDGVGVTDADTLWSWGSNDGSPNTSESFLIAPGRYLLGFSKSGGSGQYVSTFERGQAVNAGREALVDGAEVADAFALAGAVEESASAHWTLSEEEAQYRWGLRLRASLGDAPRLILEGGDGVVAESDVRDGVASLAGLGLAPGVYRVRVEGAAGMATLAAERQGRVTDGVELEPNESWDTANVLPLDRPLTGRADTDRFLFELDEAAAERARTLSVRADGRVEVRLYDAEGALLQQRRGTQIELRALVLAAGAYRVAIDGAADRDPEYEIAFEPADAPREGFEREPNDTVAGATRLGEDLTARGELVGDERDHFRLEVRGGARLWRVQVVGDGVERLRVLDGAGRRLQTTSGSRRLRLDNVRLLAGPQYVEVEGKDGAYALRVMDLGPAPEPDPGDAPDPDAPLEASPAPDDAPEDEAAADEADADASASTVPEPPPEPTGPPPPPGRMELEPNDERSRSEALRGGDVRVGTHASADDVDYYRFYLPRDQYVRLEVVPPEGGHVRFDVEPNGGRARPSEEGGATVMERWFRAGDYFLATWDDRPSGGYYQIRLSAGDSLATPVDEEPNDVYDSAARLPASLSWEGTAGTRGDSDVYRLPRFATETDVTLRVTRDDGVGYDVRTRDDRIAAPGRGDEGPLGATLPADDESYLRVWGQGDYHVEASFATDPPADELRSVPNGGASEVRIEDPEGRVTAYWHEGQRVERTVRVMNRTDADAAYEVSVRASDAAVEVDAPERVEIGAGETREVPLTIQLPPDLRDDQPVLVTVGAQHQDSVDTASLTLQPVCEAPPVGAAAYWAVPDALLGGVNVAAPQFGARIVADEPEAFASWFDGRTAPSRGAWVAPGESVTVELPGDAPVEVLGTLLHPQTRAGHGQQLRTFRVEVSRDGETFTPVLEDALETARIEQAFVFDEPVAARYARLTLLDDFEGSNRVYLGEWKLVAAPQAQAGPANVAAPDHGGYVAWSQPLLARRGAMLTANRADGRGVDMNGATEAQWVVGFHHQRAAELQALEWVESSESEPDTRFEEAEVFTSLAGPAGPWTSHGTWSLERDADGIARFAFVEPTPVRFVRLDAPKVEGRRYGHPPGQLRALERVPDGAYRSILGEWGHYRKEASFEWMAPEAADVVRLDGDETDGMASAHALAAGERIEGSVLVAEDEDWYELTLPEGQSELEIALQGDPSIGYEYALMNADGEAVYAEERQDGHDLVLRAYPEPGTYYLRLWEPKRSVVFSWDTSGSVGPFQAITYNSLAGFANDVNADREFVQLLAFDNPTPIWLLPYWSSDPERVQGAINTFDRNAASSNAEAALLKASRALEDRDGTRAVLFMTDAESGGYGLTSELWASLSRSRPRVFTFEISTAGSDYSQDLMQSWAAVNEGHYDYARNVADFDVGFARASCHLRRPKRYQVALDTADVEPPGPGRLRVGRAAGAPPPAVEVIFDASGSMGSTLPNGVPRIEAAKDVLNDLVSEVLPEGTMFAFRAFGHIAPQSCETRLDVPLTPLDPDVARAAFDAIEPKLLSQTPIAASLRQVASDLSGAGEDRAVVLITDGEESCGGDPEAALAELEDAGVDVQLSIVSLGLEEAGARERFARLAELGGGTYTDASDRESLRTSVEAAMNPVYQVLGADGEVVATGQVAGDPVELPMGVYTVRLPGDPPELVRDVRVDGDANVSVTVGGP